MIILTISNTNPILKINPNKDNINDKDNLHRCAIIWCPHHKATCYSRYLLYHNKLLVAQTFQLLENDEFNNLTFILTRILPNAWAMLSWVPKNGTLIPHMVESKKISKIIRVQSNSILIYALFSSQFMDSDNIYEI